MTEPIARVAVPSPLRRTFDYLVPAGQSACAGVRVQVPFGRGRRIGVVVEMASDSSVARARLKPVDAVLDETPLFDAGMLALLGWAADYYHHPIGEVLATALPAALRQARPAAISGQRAWRLTAAGLGLDPAALSRAPRQAQVLVMLAAAHPHGLTRADVEAGAPGGGSALGALNRRGLVEAVTTNRALLPPLIDAAPVELNAEQAAAVAAVDAAHDRFAVHLLDGVTGSGKTEVYLELTRRCVERGRQVLVLVPEIGLTPQIVERFRQRLDVPVVVAHSAMADGARANAWLAPAAGPAGGAVVLGTRSAVFTPAPALGLIIVDEEHDLSYKQQDGFRYSARDLALVRARATGVPALLGSATPSLESLHNVHTGRFDRLPLTERAGGAKPPRLEVVDLRARVLTGHLAPPLLASIEQTLAAGEQALLFVNRRGFAPALLCHDCGTVHECPRCDAKLVVHRASQRLRCHHCGLERPLPTRCPQCGSRALQPVGLGTERLEQDLNDCFPTARIARIDRDTTRRRGELEATLAAARDGHTQILVGTQMLAKGHHFPGVTLVGILDADGGLFSADFRASERLAQLIVQVAGRAGRAERPGRVLIQTHQPDHPLLVALLTGDYARFSETALAERQAAQLPPAGALALLRAEAAQGIRCTAFLEAAVALATPTLTKEVVLLGPVPAPMERRQGRYRMQLLAQSASRPPLQGFLRTWVPAFEALPEARRVRWSLDVDPQDMS